MTDEQIVQGLRKLLGQDANFVLLMQESEAADMRVVSTTGRQNIREILQVTLQAMEGGLIYGERYIGSGQRRRR